jgi:predicted GIY-YIG superfamily endonuclease
MSKETAHVRGCVYALLDYDDSIRYIGSTTRLRGRFRDHLAAKVPTTERWIKALRWLGLEPKLRVLVTLEARRDYIYKEEKIYILAYFMAGHDLLNRVRHKYSHVDLTDAEVRRAIALSRR